MDNLIVWRQVEKTDPDMTEKVAFGAFKFTTIDAQYQIMRATELFGPCGSGWGIRNQSYDMLVVDPADPHYNLLCFTAQLWYKLQNEQGTVIDEGVLDIAADIELFESTKNGWKRVSDPMKKVRTDALTKGFSWMGFSADVFMGRFDDVKYVAKLQQEKRYEIMRKEREQQRQGVELAGQLQLEAIQRLAGQANLAGPDFAAWLREQHSTSWSRLTATTADKVIASLQALLDQSSSQGSKPASEVPAAQSPPAAPAIDPAAPATEAQQDQIKALCKQLDMDSDALKGWPRGYKWTWKTLKAGQAAEAIAELQRMVDAMGEPLPGSPLAEQEIKRAQQISAQFEADRAAGKVPA